MPDKPMSNDAWDVKIPATHSNRVERTIRAVPVRMLYRHKLLEVFRRPTEKNWEGTHGISIGGGLTLWQAIGIIDPSFTKTGPRTKLGGERIHGWPQLPTRAHIALAILDVASIYRDDEKAGQSYNAIWAKVLR